MSIKVKRRSDGEFHWNIAGWLSDIALVLSLCVVILIGWDWTTVSKLVLIWIGIRLGTAYTSPDLDLHHSSAKRNWRGLGLIWEPYANLVGGHRGLLSHGINVPKAWRRYPNRVNLIRWFGWGIGTVVRTLYLISLVTLVTLVLDWVLGFGFFTVGFWKIVLSEISLYIFVGVAIADMIHVKIVDEGSKW